MAAGVKEGSFGIVKRDTVSNRFRGNPCVASFTVDTGVERLDLESSADDAGEIIASSDTFRA